MADGQIDGLPAGAIVKPLPVQGLPQGAIVKPIGASPTPAPSPPGNTGGASGSWTPSGFDKDGLPSINGQQVLGPPRLDPQMLPYIGAGLATAGTSLIAPILEDAPAWAKLAWQLAKPAAKVALASGGGAAGQVAEQELANPGKPLDTDAIKDSAVSQPAYELGGQLVGGLLKGLGSLNLISPETMEYLHALGITPTAGERKGPGLTSSMENVAGSTGVGASTAAKVTQSRTDIMNAMASKLANRLTGNIPASPISQESLALSGPASSSADALQGAATNELGQISSSRSMLLDKLSGGVTKTPANLGDIVLKSLEGKFDASELAEQQVYDDVLPDIRNQNINLEWNQARDKAASYVERALGERKMGGPALPNQLVDALTTVAGPDTQAAKDKIVSEMFNGRTTYDQLPKGIQAIVDKQVADSVPSGSFEEAWGARQRFGSMLGQLYKNGEIDSRQLGTLKDIYGSMTNDLMNSLPTNLQDKFKAAMDFTRNQKADFGQQLIKNMLHNGVDYKPEAVISTLMTRGNESNMSALLKIVGDDPQAKDALKQGAQQWLLQNSKNAADVVKNLDARPGLRQLFGSDYDFVRQGMATRAIAESTPQQLAYKSLLDTLAKGTDHTNVLDNAIKDPSYGAKLDQLFASDPTLKPQFVSDLTERLFNRATDEGRFGTPGAEFQPEKLLKLLNVNSAPLARYLPPEQLASLRDYAGTTLARDTFNSILSDSVKKGSEGVGTTFDSQKFASLWNEQRGKVASYVDQETLNNIDRFAKANKALTFNPSSSSMAGKLGTLGMLRVLPDVGGITLSLLSGEPAVAALGSVGSIAVGHYSPGIFLKLASSPVGAKLLGEGVHIPLASPQAGAWLARVSAYLNHQQDSPNAQP